MKKLIPILGILFICSLPFLYGQTITLPGMTEITTISSNDLLWVWLDPAGANATRKIQAQNLLKRNTACEIAFGNPAATSTALPNDADGSGACGNVSGFDAIISAVACRVDTGTLAINPILSGGSATSILSSPLTCGTGQTWTAGTISGTPTIRSFSANGATCVTTPCTLDANINTTDGTAKYLVMRFTISGR
jgi:hypothetical protein